MCRSLDTLMTSFVASSVAQRISLLSDQNIHQTLKLINENLTVSSGICQTDKVFAKFLSLRLLFLREMYTVDTKRLAITFLSFSFPL